MTDTQRKKVRTYRGVVAGKSGDQSVRVVLTYLTKHPKYGKIQRRRTVAHVHDAENQAQVLNYIGTLYVQEKMYEQAIQEYKESIEIDPQIYTYWNLGDVYSYSGKQGKSVGAYNDALSLVDQNNGNEEDIQNILIARACSLWLQGNLVEAKASVANIEAENAEVQYTLACFYSLTNEVDDAIDLLKQALEDPTFRTKVGDWIWKDPDLENIRGTEKFKNLFR